MIKAKDPRVQRLSAAYLFGRATLYELMSAMREEIARMGKPA